MFNVLALQEKLDADGLPYDCDSNGNLYPRAGATPAQLALAEAIRDAHNPANLTSEQQSDSARLKILQGRKYLRKQLLSATPHNPQTLVSTIKPVVDADTDLLTLVTNNIDGMSLAFGWTAASVKNPANNADRMRYVQAVKDIIALLG